ncbi:MAG: histidinol-phosphatase HisJ family protein [bacterium]
MKKIPLPDYHVHTSATEDARDSLSDLAQAAASRGLREIAVTDHYILGYKNYKVTKKILERHRRDAGIISERFGVTVRVGAEIDYFGKRIPELEKFIDSFEFDIILGSAHFVDGCGIASDEGALELFRRYDPLTAYRKSLNALELAAESGLFDVMAHPDIFRKFHDNEAAPVPFDSYRKEAERAARAIKRAGAGFEINCRGFAHSAASQYPGAEFLSVLKKAGIETVTIGSDAHKTEDVGSNLNRGFKALREAGFTHLTLFEKRKATRVPVSEFSARGINK